MVYSIMRELDYADLPKLEDSWQPPTPADPAFVERCRSYLAQARIEALAVLRNFQEVPPAANKPSVEKPKSKPKNLPPKRKSLISTTLVFQLHELYAEGATLAEIMEPRWEALGFKTPKSGLMGLSYAFHKHKLKVRKPGDPTVPLKSHEEQNPNPPVYSRVIHENDHRGRAYQAGTCLGCGVPWDENTPGCNNCASRHMQRNAKKRKESAEYQDSLARVSAIQRINRLLRAA